MISKLVKSVIRADFDGVIEDIWVTEKERILIATHNPTPVRVTSDINDEKSLHMVRVGTADVTITTIGKMIAAVTMVTVDMWEIVFVEPDLTNASRVKI